jgi:catechol 2,3-dioxygenase-like lactoylglutathione lyase family enzyme
MPTPRIQHVSIPRPPGSDDQTRAFYAGVLGLTEVPLPPALQSLDLIWYRLGDTELHLFAEEPRADTSGRHLCIEVSDLAGLRQRLNDAGYTTEDTIEIVGRPRFFSRDPFGNSIEFTTILGDYLQGLEVKG